MFPAALIPIDVQQAFADPPWSLPGLDAAEANGLALLAAWREAGQPLLHVRHDSVQPGSRLSPGQPGHAFRPGFAPRAGEPLVGKSVNAAFIGTDLDLRLRRLGLTRLVLFGFTTDMCVSTTARVAANLGYQVTVVADACTTFAQPDADGTLLPAELIHRTHLATLRSEFAQVMDTAAVIARLRERAMVPRSPGTARQSPAPAGTAPERCGC